MIHGRVLMFNGPFFAGITVTFAGGYTGSRVRLQKGQLGSSRLGLGFGDWRQRFVVGGGLLCGHTLSVGHPSGGSAEECSSAGSSCLGLGVYRGCS